MRIGLGAISWGLLMFGVVLATAAIFWMALAAVLLGSAPQGTAIVGLAIVLAFSGALYWLVTRYVTPKRIAGRLVGLMATVLLLAGTVWAASSRDDALFVARDMAWGESDVLDYQKFPSRAVHNGSAVFRFHSRPAPERFETIKYTVDGEVKEAAFGDFLRSTNTTAFIVVKDGAVVYERYLNGYKRDSIATSFSVAKSVTSALVGIAIDEGFIRSVDGPIVDYLPELRGRGYDDVTIRDLLLMSTGIKFVHDEDLSDLQDLWPFASDVALAYSYPNLRRLVLHLPPSKEPVGVAFNYNPYHPILLGMILERTTHRPVAEYLQEKLWQPLGMEYPASWSLDSKSDGFEKMESGLNARAIDFAKLGQLFLDNGRWNGTQVISKQWVTASTVRDPRDHRPFLSYADWKGAGGYYKYMWWGMRTADGGYYYSARGHLGQLIAVFPRDRLVIVRFGRNENGVDSWDKVIETVAAKAS
ncbi:MAG: beta-lactamase family protein [Actinomycetota bacterium]|nr:beta-lactamase family protein [Actinomycetota bacterium]